MVQVTVETFGGLDILVIDAGIGKNPAAAFTCHLELESSEEDGI